MAPLRNRSTRTATEPDPFEGLPVRQWRQVQAQVGPPPEIQPIVTQHRWPELPMPRDSHLLPEHSMHLLRLARSNAGWKRKSDALLEDEDKENGADGEEDGTSGANGNSNGNGNTNVNANNEEPTRGFSAKKWSQVPRNLEEPEIEYLAKRRKGLPPLVNPSAFGGPAVPLIATTAMRKTKVRRLDADGVAHVYEVLAPEGQKLEGEIEEEEEAQAVVVEPAAAPGTVVEGVGIVNAEGIVVANDLLQPTPNRRKPPPPRKKKKSGPGRGHKKVVFKDTDDSAGATGSTTGNMLSVPGTSADGQSSVPASTQGDTPMPDAPDGEEEEGSSGEDEDDEGREDGELSPSPEPKLPHASTLPAAEPFEPVEAAKEINQVFEVPSVTRPKKEIAEESIETDNIPIEAQTTEELPSLGEDVSSIPAEQPAPANTESNLPASELDTEDALSADPAQASLPTPEYPASAIDTTAEVTESVPALPGLGELPLDGASTAKDDGSAVKEPTPLIESAPLPVPQPLAVDEIADGEISSANALQPSTEDDAAEVELEPGEPTIQADEPSTEAKTSDGEIDLFSSLEKQLESSTPVAPAAAIAPPPPTESPTEPPTEPANAEQAQEEKLLEAAESIE